MRLSALWHARRLKISPVLLPEPALKVSTGLSPSAFWQAKHFEAAIVNRRAVESGRARLRARIPV
eukprot:4118591-Pyramimonas_sp.AAC.1